MLLLLDTAYACVRRRASELRESGDREQLRCALTALTFLLEGVLQSLNAHVDGAILACYAATRDDRIEAGDHSKHRDVLLAALEKRFVFKRKELPQWDAVDTTSRQANAVKHRLGLTFKDTAEGQLALEGVNLSERDLLLRLDTVHEWVIALGRTAGLIPPATA